MIDFNTKLFLKINSWVGKNKWLDAFGRAGAEFVIVAMGGWYFVSVMVGSSTLEKLYISLISLPVAWIFAWLLDLGIAFLVREDRPQVQMPEVKQLFSPMMAWKSFPSDHAMSAFLMFFLALLFGLPYIIGLFFLALWVVWGRIYCGVHYPLDALAGFLTALVSSLFIYYFLIILNFSF